MSSNLNTKPGSCRSVNTRLLVCLDGEGRNDRHADEASEPSDSVDAADSNTGVDVVDSGADDDDDKPVELDS